jgi:hypothetical protein
MRNPIIYVGGPGYSGELVDSFDPIARDMESNFQRVIDQMAFARRDGTACHITVEVQVGRMESNNAIAKRVRDACNKYEIKFHAGLLYHVWLASRLPLVNFSYFPWLERCKLEKEYRKDGRKKILAEKLFYIMAYFVLFHELAHIVLGHIDFIADHLRHEDGISEVHASSGSTERRIPDDISQPLEADADRQAGLWSVALFDMALGADGRGTELRYPDTFVPFELYTFGMCSWTALLQQFLREKGSTGSHPKPLHRQFVTHAFLAQFFDQFHPENSVRLMTVVSKAMIKANRQLGLEEADRLETYIESARYMEWVGEQITKLGVRNYQMRASTT